MELTDITTPSKVLTPGTLISTRFRSGNEVHAALSNSTMSTCGRYMKNMAIGRRMYVAPTCELCLAKLEGK